MTNSLKQMTVADWMAEFYRNPKAVVQVGIIERRAELGMPLATWEQNCIEAHRQITTRAA